MRKVYIGPTAIVCDAKSEQTEVGHVRDRVEVDALSGCTALRRLQVEHALDNEGRGAQDLERAGERRILHVQRSLQ
eukprot:SAG11_NODE_22255_length_409_cov_1.006452_1_plen_75_part_01